MEVKQSKIQKEIVKVSVKPSKNWIRECRKELENVTNINNKRISFYGLFNFISLIQMNKSLKFTLTALATVTALGVTGVMTASSVNASAPGDFLYGLDRAYEVLGSTVQFSDTAKADYQIDLLEERAAEAVLLEEKGDEELLDKALENLETAEEATLERVRKAEDNENSETGDLERIRARLELQLDEAVQTKEQVKKMYEKKGNDSSAAKVGASIEKSKKDAEEYRDSSKVNSVESDTDDMSGNHNENGDESEFNSETHDGEGSYMEQEQNGEENSGTSGNSESGIQMNDYDHGFESH